MNKPAPPPVSIFIVASLVSLANLTKPAHIDDTLYVAIARQIVADPLDPYGGILNWQQIPEPTYKTSISPPLLNYYFAALIAMFGQSILILHAAMAPWIFLAIFGVYRLAERWTATPIATTLVVATAPVFVVGINLMLDVPMTACACWSIEQLFRAVDRCPRRGWARSLVFSGCWSSTAVLIKYSAVALIPLIVISAALVQCGRDRSVGAVVDDGLRSLTISKRLFIALVAVMPVLAFVGWQSISQSIYGSSQVKQGIGFLSQFRVEMIRQNVERSLTMLAIFATTFPLWITIIAASPFRSLIIPFLAAGVAGATSSWLLDGNPMIPTATSAAFSIAAAAGTCALMRLLSIIFNRQSMRSGTILVCGVLGFCAVAILFGPFVAARSLLPATPALAILAAVTTGNHRRFERAIKSAIAVNVVLSALLFWADWRWAASYREAVSTLDAKYGDDPIYFCGHWGWQYYAESAGFRPWDARWLTPPADGILVIPMRADKQFVHPLVLNQLQLVDHMTIDHHPLYLSTWNKPAGFRFYGGDFGQLPWGFSAEPIERFHIYRLPSQ